MMQTDFPTIRVWHTGIRVLAISYLFCSALMAIGWAVVISVLGVNGDDKLVQGALTLFGGAAAALGWAIRKQRRLSWKHWIAITVFAMPAVLGVLLR